MFFIQFSKCACMHVCMCVYMYVVHIGIDLHMICPRLSSSRFQKSQRNPRKLFQSTTLCWKHANFYPYHKKNCDDFVIYLGSVAISRIRSPKFRCQNMWNQHASSMILTLIILNRSYSSIIRNAQNIIVIYTNNIQ